jgi:hypothetical protein
MQARAAQRPQVSLAQKATALRYITDTDASGMEELRLLSGVVAPLITTSQLGSSSCVHRDIHASCCHTTIAELMGWLSPLNSQQSASRSMRTGKGSADSNTPVTDPPS